MTLKVYKKADIKIVSADAPQKTVELFAKTPGAKRPEKSRGLSYQAIDKSVKIGSIALIVLGFGILVFTGYPYASYYVEKLFAKEDAEVLSSGGDGDVLAVESRFSPQYFDNVEQNIAKVSAELANAPEDYSSVTGEFYLTIPKIDINRVPVQINVDSFDEEKYLEVLHTRFAHFKGTSIPGKPGTTFVYSHSTPEWYARTHRNYVPSMFTFLVDLSVGDEILVEYNGMKYTYTVTRVYESNPDDLSPVFEQTSRKLLKLMTCSPPGVGTDRLIVVTEQIKEEKI